MARLATSGGALRDHQTTDIGSPDGVSGGTAATTTELSIVRSGNCSLLCSGTSTLTAFRWWPFAGALATGYYTRAYLRFSALPSATKKVLAAVTAADGVLVSARLTSGGKLQLWNDVAGTQIGSDSDLTLAVDTFYRIELYFKITSANTDEAELRILDAQFEWEDGTTVASATGLTVSNTAPGRIRAGWIDAPGVTSNMYVDDVALNDSTGTANNSWAGAGSVFLLPALLVNEWNSWKDCSDGAGAAANYLGVLDNSPPIGIADHTDASHLSDPHHIGVAVSGPQAFTFYTVSFARVGLVGDVSTGESGAVQSFKLGSSSTERYAATSFYINGTLQGGELFLQKTGSPADDLVIELYDSVESVPPLPGTNVLATTTISASSVSSSGAWIPFSLAAPLPLTSSARYWIAIHRSGSDDASNYVQWWASGNTPTRFVDGFRATKGTGAWASVGYGGLCFRLFTSAGAASIRAAQAFCCHAEAITTGTKTGTVAAIAPGSPAIPAASFEFGDNLGLAGTYPSNWRWAKTTTVASDIAHAGQSLFISVTKTDTTTRKALLGYAGAYFEYTNPRSGWQQYQKTSDSSLWWANQSSVETTMAYGDPATPPQLEVTCPPGDWLLLPDPLPDPDGGFVASVVIATTTELQTDYTLV
jgi:hypothetical protein